MLRLDKSCIDNWKWSKNIMDVRLQKIEEMFANLFDLTTLDKLSVRF